MYVYIFFLLTNWLYYTCCPLNELFLLQDSIQLLIKPLLLYLPTAPYTCHRYDIHPITNTFSSDVCIYGIHGNVPLKNSSSGVLTQQPPAAAQWPPQHYTKATFPWVLPVNDKYGRDTRPISVRHTTVIGNSWREDSFLALPRLPQPALHSKTRPTQPSLLPSLVTGVRPASCSEQQSQPLPVPSLLSFPGILPSKSLTWLIVSGHLLLEDPN